MPATWAPATLFAQAFNYSPSYFSESLRGKFEFYLQSVYTAPSQPVIQAIGLGGTTGVDIGAKCNRLYVDFNRPVLLLVATAYGRGGNGRSGPWRVPWHKAFEGVNLFIQAAWTDSKSKQLSLTQALRLRLPWGLPPAEEPRFKTVYNRDPDSSSTRFGIANSVGNYFPFTRYGIK